MFDHLQIRAYQSGDEQKILDLFRLAYGGRELPLNFWEWRFRNNPAGAGVIELSWDDQLLAAHYAVTSVVTRIAGKDYHTGLSGTTMTHPEYRGKGLFPVLARSTYARMKAANMAMVWGFPNAMSHRGFVRNLNWKDIYEIPMFRRTISPSMSMATMAAQICELSVVDERFDRLWERVCDDYAIIGRRDQAHLEWRYLSNSTEQYRLLAYIDGGDIHGYAVTKRYQDELQVVDLLTGREATDVGTVLISHILQLAVQETATSVSLWLNSTLPMHHALEKMGFQPEGAVTYLGGLALQPEFGDTLYDFRNWYFTMGDSDVF